MQIHFCAVMKKILPFSQDAGNAVHHLEGPNPYIARHGCQFSGALLLDKRKKLLFSKIIRSSHIMTASRHVSIPDKRIGIDMDSDDQFSGYVGGSSV